MADHAAGVLDLCTASTWQCMSDLSQSEKSPIYDQFFSSHEAMHELVVSLPLAFTPKLRDTLTAVSAPGLDFFKSLTVPNMLRSHWGIYVIVLKKDGHSPIVYIGSATSRNSGLASRMYHYDTKILLPSLVETALGNGFAITNKGTLVSMARPADATKVPISRLIFVALEGMFAFVFGVVKNANNARNMDHLCLWDRASIEYEPGCTHTCFKETPRGDYNLTTDTILVMAKSRETKFRELKAKNATNHHYKQMAENYDEYITKSHQRVAKSRALNPELHRRTERERIQRDIEAKRYYCKDCDVAFSRPKILAIHLASAKHAAHLIRHTTPYYCALCDRGYNDKSGYKAHLKNQRHQKAAAAAAVVEDDEE